jgi:hypothetical protein
MKQYKTTVQTIQNTVNTSTYITKTPPHTHSHTLQNKLKQPQYKIHAKWNNHNTINYPQYKVTLMYMVLLFKKNNPHRCIKSRHICLNFQNYSLGWHKIWFWDPPCYDVTIHKFHLTLAHAAVYCCDESWVTDEGNLYRNVSGCFSR